MLTTNRIVPVLLIRDGLLVKTERFKKPQYVGDPVNAVKIFNEKEVDELVILDMRAARNRKVDLGTIETIASEAFMPVAYGGGIDSVETARAVVHLGIEKVILSSAWATDNRLITELANVLGAQAVVAGVDYQARLGKVEAVTHGGERRIRRALLDVCRELEAQGAGELLVQSVDRDGTMKGMDLESIKKVSRESSIPIMALGGAGKASHLADALKSGASAVGAASMFLFHGRHRAVLITYPTRETIARIMSSDGLT